jgi:hypothetical protein
MTDKNIYQKLQEARVELQKLNLKKTGRNTYSNFTYYELGDFLPYLNNIMLSSGIITAFSIIKTETIEEAVLEVFNASKPEEKITFRLPTAEAEIGKKKDGTGGADPIQNLGGKTTYMRRYLMMIAFEIVESDYVDKNPIHEELDDKSKEKIDNAKSMDELKQVYEDLREKLDKKFTKSLVGYCQKRKEILK